MQGRQATPPEAWAAAADAAAPTIWGDDAGGGGDDAAGATAAELEAAEAADRAVTRVQAAFRGSRVRARLQVRSAPTCCDGVFMCFVCVWL